MFKRILKTAVLLTLMFLLMPLSCTEKKTQKKPNIVFIMVDDLGYGDIGCYGSKINKTPNIDRLAAKGILFTDYHTNGPMCSPTRASLMTGMYQHRFGRKFERAISGKTDYDDGLPREAFTIAELLKQAGYVTGMFGKWHLGYHPPYLPSDQGFDEFIGLAAGDGDHFTHIDRWGREDWWLDDSLRMEVGYSTHLLTDHSIEFIKKHKEEPFFLYLPYLAIHFPWQGPNDPPHRRAGHDYTNDKWGIIEDRNNVSPHVKAMIEAVDAGVGKIIKTLSDLGLEKNTLLIFTSDNGGYTHYADSHFNISSNGPLRGQKTEIWEGGHRVPFISYWPGKIKGGVKSDAMIMTMDMYPSFAALAGIDVPKNLKIDGINVLPQIIEGKPLKERSFFWKIGDERAVRKGKWKLCLLGSNPPELYDLSVDIGEKNNIAQKHPQVVQQLMKEYDDWQKDVTAGY